MEIALDLRSTSAGPVKILAPEGRIDHAQAPLLEAALREHLENCRAGGDALLLDFSGVDYISSVGLRVLMLAARKAASQKGRVAIAALQPMVREVFEISRFHLVVKVHDTLDAGVQALGAPA